MCCRQRHADDAPPTGTHHHSQVHAQKPDRSHICCSISGGATAVRRQAEHVQNAPTKQLVAALREVEVHDRVLAVQRRQRALCRGASGGQDVEEGGRASGLMAGSQIAGTPVPATRPAGTPHACIKSCLEQNARSMCRAQPTQYVQRAHQLAGGGGCELKVEGQQVAALAAAALLHNVLAPCALHHCRVGRWPRRGSRQGRQAGQRAMEGGMRQAGLWPLTHRQ